MSPEEFQDVLLERFAKSEALLCSKAAEYAPGSDRLSNFKVAGAFQRCTPERALWGMVSKHLVALGDFMDMLEAGECPPCAWWEEKLGDSIAYLILLDGLLSERFASICSRKKPGPLLRAEEIQSLFGSEPN